MNIKSVLFAGMLWLGFSCQSEGPQPPVELPGLAPFLEAEMEGLDDRVAALTLEQKLQRLLLLKTPATDLVNGQVPEASGYLLTGARLADLSRLRALTSGPDAFPALIGIAPGRMANHLFGAEKALPPLATVQAMGDDSLNHRLLEAYRQQASALGLSWLSIPGYGMEGGAAALPDARVKEQLRFINQMSKSNRLAFAAPFAGHNLLQADTTKAYQNARAYHNQLVEAGLGGLWLKAEWLQEPMNARLSYRIRRDLQFGGLMVAEIASPDQIAAALSADADLLAVNTANYPQVMEALQRALKKGLLNEAVLGQKIKRILSARAWAKPQPAAAAPNPPAPPALEASLAGAKAESTPGGLSAEAYFRSPDWHYWQQRAYTASLVLAANPGAKVPLPAGKGAWAILHLPATTFDRHFEKQFGKYSDYRVVHTWAEAATAGRLIVLLDQYKLSPGDYQQLEQAGERAEVVVVNLGHPDNLQELSRKQVVVQAFGNSDIEKERSAQLLFGGIAAEGRLPMTYSPEFLMGQGEKTAPVRLAFGGAHEAGILPEKLVGIDAIVESAIDEKAIPGAQVLVARRGHVVYNKTFGYHTYDTLQPVRPNDLYDVASITKIAATTLVAMQQHEKEAFRVKDRLRHHLELPRRSRLRNISIRKLMTHQSGLQPHLPVIPYLLARSDRNDDCSTYFCKDESAEFAIPVADSFYFSTRHYGEIWEDMQRLRSRRTRYRYSDANFVLTQRLLEALGGKGLDTLAGEGFYEPLGLRHTRFKPRLHYQAERLVPTELDYRWRHQLVHGFVHDETAALLGGVAGHAGLFSNAEGLAVLFQMLLNGGHYGGRQYLNAETIAYFTSASHGNHRGLGFDKPEEKDIEEGGYPEAVSEGTYGHTGFTGTCVWVDPEEELIYIFLSNRVHPNRDNRKLFQLKVRERIHRVIYDALDSFEPEWPELANAGEPSFQNPLQ